MLRGLPCLVGAYASLATPAAAQASDQPPPSLTGDWGGLRPQLHEDGVDLSIGYTSETAGNVAGGNRDDVREAAQLSLGATIDAEKLAGIKGGTFQATITYRRGYELGAASGLGLLQQPQEIYGRGQTWRLTQFWYQQSFADGHVDVKVGRLTAGEDFDAFSCEFMNLTFCGAPPGNIVGDYWYNWPVSQWAGRLRVKSGSYYAQIGAFEVNPRNLDNDFTIGKFHGATGVLIPVEVGWQPRLFSRGLPGSYKFGGWYDTSGGNGLFLDVNHAPQTLTGAAPLHRSGRYGVYLGIQQQLTGTAQRDRTTAGLSIFLNVTQADRQTARIDSQIAAGLFYTGAIKARPDDSMGLAIGRTNVNSRANINLEIASPGTPVPHAEYTGEIYYALHVTGWLTLRPNVQYVIDPGGFDRRKNVAVLGLKAGLNL